MAGGTAVVQYDNPTVLVSRPAEGAAAFVRSLKACKDVFEPILAPAFGYQYITYDFPDFDNAIFTSKIGVETAPEGQGRVAWCVGDATTNAARKKGYDGRNASGDAEALIKVILEARPMARLLHIRGETSRGNITRRLVSHGLRCVDAVTYLKAPLDPPDCLHRQLMTRRSVIVPLFSAETVSILSDWGLSFRTAHVVAISRHVETSARILTPRTVTISNNPDLASMTHAVAALIT